jgi:hypothetical protein
MILKIILTHAIEGSIEIPEPDGWKNAEVGLERDPDLWTCTPYLKTPFDAYGDFRAFMLLVEQNHGPDAIVTAQVQYCEEERGFNFQELFPNCDIEIAVGSFTETVGGPSGHSLEWGFVMRSAYAKFQQRFETPVNVQSEEDLDGEEVEILEALTIPMTGQTIEKKTIFDADPIEAEDLVETDSFGFGFSYDDELQEFNFYTQAQNDKSVGEIDISYDTYFDFTDDPVNLQASIEFEEDGEIAVSMPAFQAVLKLAGLANAIDPTLNNISNVVLLGEFFYQKNEEAAVSFGFIEGDSAGGIIPGQAGVDDGGAFEKIFTIDFPDYSETVSISAGERIKFYVKWTLQYFLDTTNGEEPVLVTNILSINSYPSAITVIQQSTFPDTEAEGFLTHDLLHSVTKRISGLPVYSEVLGSPNTIARQYDYVGCAANFMHFKGLQLRQYLLTQKPFFISAKDIWNGINPVHCLAMGMDKVNGENVIRVWKRSELFDENRISATLDNVRDISRSYDQEEFFNLITIGYDKWQSEDVSGIDDPQSRRNYATILKKIGRKIEILSSMIGASLAFETTRRFIKDKSADYKFDNETFILAVTLDGEYGFRPELNEEFSDVSNLLNEETRYNKRITSARNLLRWLEYLSGCLQMYSDSSFKFTGGEGNYDTVATMAPNECGDDFGGAPLSEKQDIPVSEDYLFWPIAYTIKHPISFGKWLQIISDMHAAINVSQTDINHMPFFTKNLSIGLADAQMTLTAWPKRFFSIGIPQNMETERENRVGRRFDDTFGPEFN